jgi:hypothetical protein
MCGWEFCNSDVGGSFVCFEGLVCALLAFISKSEFSKVTMIISFPVEVSITLKTKTRPQASVTTRKGRGIK